jgi:hypothetical protein
VHADKPGRAGDENFHGPHFRKESIFAYMTTPGPQAKMPDPGYPIHSTIPDNCATHAHPSRQNVLTG